MMKTSLLVIAALALTIGPAILQGHYANRWGTPPDLSAAGERLHQFPRIFGDWKNSEDERPLSDAVCRELGLVDHFHRQYVNRTTGERVNLLLMVGPPGRLVRHPPSVCYANRANELIGSEKSLEIENSSNSHQFKLLRFRRTSQPVSSEFNVAYAFGIESGDWTTPNSPRMEFGGLPILYKLQVLTEESSESADAGVRRFLADFVEAFPQVSLPQESEIVESE